MKKRIFSFLLALWMILSLVPVSALAEDVPDSSPGQSEAAPEPPKVEEPKAETPKVETPKVETPQVETPKLETPKLETPKLETPKLETPQLETPQLETPQLETPQLETPQLETPKLETPKLETPKLAPTNALLTSSPLMLVTNDEQPLNDPEPICTCSVKCQEPNEGCELCKTGIEGCTGKQAQAALTVSCSPAEPTLATETLTLTVSGGSTDGAITCTSGGATGSDTTFTIPVTHAGEYSFAFSKAGNDTYLPVTANFSVNVPKAELTATIDGTPTKVYDGTTDIASPTIKLSSLVGSYTEVTASAASATLSDANAGTVEITASGISLGGSHAGNYTVNTSATATATITKNENPTITLTNYPTTIPFGQDVSFPMTEQIQLTGATKDEVAYAWKDDRWPGEIGTYELILSIPDTSNHAAKTASFPVTVTKGVWKYSANKTVYITSPGQSGSITVDELFGYSARPEDVSITGISPAAGAVMESVAVSGGKITYTAKNEDTSGSDTYIVTLDSSHYKDFDVTVTFLRSNLPPAQISLTPTAKTPVYNGSAQAAFNYAVTSEGYTGTVTCTYSGTDGYGTAYGPSETPPTNAGDYRATITAAATDKYAGSSITADFSILPKTIKPTITVTDPTFPAEPTVTVTGDGKTLERGKDFDFYGTSGPSNGGAGKYTIAIFSCGGNYTFQEVSKSFTLKAKTVTPKITVSSPNVYTGEALKPAVTVTYGDNDTPMMEGVDYSLSYSDNVKAGTGKVRVKRLSSSYLSFSDTTVTFTIDKQEIVPVITFTDTKPITYNGSAHEPAITVKVGDTVLTKGTDYTLSYTNNTNASTAAEPALAVIQAAATSGYTFAKTSASFIILPKEVTPRIKVLGDKLYYTGSALEPKIQLMDGTTEIPYAEGKEYTYSFSNNINAGTAAVTIADDGTGNYKLKAATQNFYIYPAELTITGAELADKDYDGTTDATVTSVSFKDGKGTAVALTDYTAAAFYDLPDAGTNRKATVTVTLNASVTNYNLETNTFSLTKQTIGQLDDTTATTTVYVREGDTKTQSVSLAKILAADPALKGTPVYGTVTQTGSILDGAATVKKGSLQYRILSTAAKDETAAVTIEVGGLTNYNKVTITVNIKVTDKKIQKALSIASPGAKAYGDADFTLKTSGGSGSGDVQFASSDSSILTITSDGKATIVKPGTVVITAVKDGGSAYEDADATLVLTIGKRKVTVTAKDEKVNIGEGMPAFTYKVSGLLEDLGHTFTDPIITTKALDTKSWGTFDINIRGGVLSHPDYYEVAYKKGTLTIVPMGYKIIEGAKQLVIPGRAAKFVSNADCEDFVCVLVDGKVLSESHYTYASGSTIVTLSKAYTKTLKAGKHTLTIVSTDGEAATYFNIKAYDSSPQTGDTTNNGLWIALALVALVGFAGSLMGKQYLLKRKDS